MKKALASIGVGNATVDTALPFETVRPGETVDADVHTTGGDATPEVGAIGLELVTRVRIDDGYREVDVDRVTLAEGLTIEPGQEETRPVSIEPPTRRR